MNDFTSIPPQMGVRGKAKSLWGAAPKLPHWLDHARATHGTHLVEDVRCFTSLLVLLLPLPFFWALFDQQVLRIIWSVEDTAYYKSLENTMSVKTVFRSTDDRQVC